MSREIAHRRVAVDIAAGEIIHRGVAVFGPGMNRQVAFFHHDHPAHPVGAENVEHALHDGGPAQARGLVHQPLDVLRIVQYTGFTIIKFR